MITVSLCMIVRNEEATLARCLESVRSAVDEIIIVDTGSTDRTKEIAAEFTDRIFDFEWIDDFSAARNFAYSQATMDYIMWLDADDIFLPADLEKFKSLKKKIPPDTDAVMMKYNTSFDDAGVPVFTFFRERLTRRQSGFVWCEPVHEFLQIGGNVAECEIAVTHAKPEGRSGEGGRNIRIYESLLARGEKLTPRGTYYYARELRDHGRFREAAEWFARFLDGGGGWVEDNISACGRLAECLTAIGESDKALTALFRSFQYDVPDAEICCQTGLWFKERNKFAQAAYWYEAALRCERKGWGFRQEDFYGFIPCMQLTFLYFVLNERERAEEYNERAAKFRPDSPEVEHNRKFFSTIRGEK